MRVTMTADEIRGAIYQAPFRPFRVRLTTGDTIEINRTLRTTVAEDRVNFGVNEDPETGLAKRMRMVPLHEIASIELK
jgi:hypothetical protein